MPEGKLELSVVDAFGDPVAEAVDVFLRNQTLSDAPAFRQLDVSKPRVLKGLNVFPNGKYRIEVDALSYHTVSRFVDIPPDGDGSVVITLPINPKKVIRAEFPAFGSTKVTEGAWELLKRSSKVMNFSGKSGPALYDALDDVRKAGFLDLVAKADRTRFRASNDEPPRSVLPFVQEITELRGDRFFAVVPRELRSEVIHSVTEDLFHDANAVLHTPPPGFVRDRSFKTFDQFGNLQLSFFAGVDGTFALDMDIDDAQGFAHFFQVVGIYLADPHIRTISTKFSSPRRS